MLKSIKLLVLDVDGVLTKGEIIYDDKGRELKMFNVKDGLGVYLLGRTGIKTVFLTAKDSPVVRRRAKDMGVAQVIAGILPKEKVIDGLTRKYRVEKSELCFIGDDLIDIGVMRAVGLAIAPSDAPKQVRAAADLVTRKKGGEGAVREVVDLIFDAQGLTEKVYHAIKNPVKA